MALQLVLTVLLAVSALVKLADLVLGRQERTSAALLAGSFAQLSLAFVVSTSGPTEVLDSVVRGITKIIYNGLTYGGFFLLLVFFLRAVYGAAATRRRIRWELALVVGMVLLLTTIMILTPYEFRGHDLDSPYLGEPSVAAFYVLGGLYYTRLYAIVVRLIWRYVRGGHGPLAWALRLVLVGILGLAVTSLVRMGRVLAIFLGAPPLPALNTVNFQVSLLAGVLFVVGLVVAGVGHALSLLRLRRARRRQYLDLEPLWVTLTSLYPEIVLHGAAETGAQHRWLPDSWNRRLYRRVLECRDGLLRSGPVIAGAAGTADLGALPPERIAVHLRDLAAHGLPGATNGTHSADPVSVATPVGAGIGGDVAALVAISEALPAGSARTGR